MTNITLTALILVIVASIVIPGVAALLSRAHWDPFWTGIITITLAAANGFIAEWQANVGGYDWKHGALLAVISWAVAVGARIQLWAGTAKDAKLLAFPQPRPAPPAPEAKAA